MSNIAGLVVIAALALSACTSAPNPDVGARGNLLFENPSAGNYQPVTLTVGVPGQICMWQYDADKNSSDDGGLDDDEPAFNLVGYGASSSRPDIVQFAVPAVPPDVAVPVIQCLDQTATKAGTTTLTITNSDGSELDHITVTVQ